ncbi:MAG: phosphoglucosamine mutase [Elusimicrobiota bacterium]|jgi:phosphoglucosamine mutase|nr:phosphoglucosamine mutase [Elusimicrobiota bacterium]
MKLFGTDGIRGLADAYPFDNYTLSIIGASIAEVLGAKGKKILIISDTRQSAPRICKYLSCGLAYAGAEAIFAQVLPTPAASFLTSISDYEAAIVISASHNPYTDNGIKIFASNGLKLLDETEQKIEKLICKYQTQKIQIPIIKNPFIIDDTLLQKYENFLIENFPAAMRDFFKDKTIVLDCANGAAYLCAPAVYKALGAKVLAFNVLPDGKNINDQCGALHPEFAAGQVKKNKAFCGFCFDGDGDRLICIDEQGNIRDGDFFLFAMAKYLKSRNKLKNNILVSTVMANLGLFNACKKENIEVLKTQVGDRYVLEAININNASLGGEQSGHFIFRDILPTGDGLLSSVLLLEAVMQNKTTVSSFFEGLQKFPQILINHKVAKKVPIDQLPKTSALIKKYEQELADDGRILVRYSGTENLARVMVEAKDEGRLKPIAQNIMDILLEETNDKAGS